VKLAFGLGLEACASKNRAGDSPLLPPARSQSRILWLHDLDLTGKQPVRDLWQCKDLGSFDGGYSIKVPAHGVILLNIGTPDAQNK
jgi:hypothetical protein